MTFATLRFRRPRNTADQFGQVFTPPSIAKLLVEAIPPAARKVVDVGAGHGVLARAAIAQCRGASATLIEQDVSHVQFLREQIEKCFNVVQADALSPGLIEKLIGRSTKPVILSNPPYGMLQSAHKFTKNDAEMVPVIDGAGWVRGDVAFMSRIWDATNLGATLGLIVASPIICGSAYSQLRKVLVERMSNLVITELNSRTFAGAEVRAFIITGTRSVKRSRNVLLRLADEQGQIQSELAISNAEAALRLDYSYHSVAAEFSLKSAHTLGTLAELEVSVTRGSRSQKAFKALGYAAFHTTNFARDGKFLELSGAAAGYNTADPGDILIPRVGTRCLLHEARVVSGVGLITDCVYRIRANEKVRENVWRTLNSSFGREWRTRFAEGSCAKYLTITSIKSLPILR